MRAVSVLTAVMLGFAAVALLVVWFNRRAMLTRGAGVTEVLMSDDAPRGRDESADLRWRNPTVARQTRRARDVQDTAAHLTGQAFYRSRDSAILSCQSMIVGDAPRIALCRWWSSQYAQ